MLRRATRKLAWEIESVERAEEEKEAGINIGIDNENEDRALVKMRKDALIRMEYLGREVVPRSYL